MAVGPVVLLLILNAIIIFSLRNAELENVSSKPTKINENQLIVKNNYYNAPTTTANIYQKNVDNNINEINQNKIVYDKKSLEKIELKNNSESMPLLNNTILKNCPKLLSPPSLSMSSLLPPFQHLPVATTVPSTLSNGSFKKSKFLSTITVTPKMPCNDNKLYNNKNCSTIIDTSIKPNQKIIENNLDEENDSATDIMTLVLVVCLFISCNILVSFFTFTYV